MFRSTASSPNFFQPYWDFDPKSWIKFYVQSRCSLWEINKKPSWKWENLVSTIFKTISKISIVFSNCLQNEVHICNFFTLDDILVGKLTVSASLRKIHFPKILEQAPLICMKNAESEITEISFHSDFASFGDLRRMSYYCFSFFFFLEIFWDLIIFYLIF